MGPHDLESSSFLEHLFARKILMVTGKGGVGKTWVASSLALEASRMGKKVCLLECSSRSQVAPLFGLPSKNHQRLAFSDHLDVMNLDTELNLRDFLVNQLGLEKVFEKVFDNKIVKSFLQFIPGLPDLVLLGRFYHEIVLNKKDNYDLVVFDGFSSGHFFHLMTIPQVIADAQVTGPILEVTNKVTRFLYDPENAGIVSVAAPEPLIVSECLEFCDRITDAKAIPLAAVLLNRVPWSYFESANQKSLSENPSAVELYLARKAEQALRSIETIQSHFAKGRTDSLLLGIAPDLGAVEEPVELDMARTYYGALRRLL